MSYFKYTNGESFTLNGNDYIGYFHLSNGVPYTGRDADSNSKKLSVKNTFMGESFKRGYEFDSNYPNFEKISPVNILSGGNILDINNITTTFTNYDDNNFKIFSNLITTRSSIFDFSVSNTKFYALPYKRNHKDTEYLNSYKEYVGVHPFEDLENFNMLGSVIAEDFVVEDDDTFKYFCSSLFGYHILKGSFKSPREVKTYEDNTWGVERTWNANVGVKYTDETYKRVYYPDLSTYFEPIESNIIVDNKWNLYNTWISMKPKWNDSSYNEIVFIEPPSPDILTVEREVIKYGGDYSNMILKLMIPQDTRKTISVDYNYTNIYDSSNYQYCPYTKSGNDPILENSIPHPRASIKLKWNTFKKKWGDNSLFLHPSQKNYNDDNLNTINFGKKYRTLVNSNDEIELYELYGKSLIKTIVGDFGKVLDLDIRDVDDEIVVLHKLNDDFYITFVSPDDTIQIKTPHKLESFDQCCDVKVKFIYEDSNLISTSNNTQYQLRYITNPTYPCGDLKNSNLYLIKKMVWGEVKEFFNNILLTWNNEKRCENSDCNFHVTMKYKNGKMYAIIRGSGRIYTMYQPVGSRIKSFVDRYIERSYTTENKGDSSIGIIINNMTSSIIKDIHNIYGNLEKIPKFDSSGIIDESPNNIEMIPNELKININEDVNASTLKRIFDKIYIIQNTNDFE